MKHLCLSLVFLSLYSLSTFGQVESNTVNGLFYKIGLATTLTINEEFEISEDSDETFFNPSALYINNTFGYQFDWHTSVDLNIGYNWHSQQGLHFVPAYLSLRHNFVVDDSNIFLRTGYGYLLDVGNAFENGNMYKVGLGFQFYGDTYNESVLFGIDFTRKRFGNRNLEGLSSVSIFLEFMLF